MNRVTRVLREYKESSAGPLPSGQDCHGLATVDLLRQNNTTTRHPSMFELARSTKHCLLQRISIRHSGNFRELKLDFKMCATRRDLGQRTLGSSDENDAADGMKSSPCQHLSSLMLRVTTVRPLGSVVYFRSPLVVVLVNAEPSTSARKRTADDLFSDHR